MAQIAVAISLFQVDQATLSKIILMEFLLFEKLLARVQINPIAAPDAIRSFPPQLRTLLPGLNMMSKADGIGITHVGLSATIAVRALSAREMHLAIKTTN